MAKPWYDSEGKFHGEAAECSKSWAHCEAGV